MPTNELWAIERRTRRGKAYAWREWTFFSTRLWGISQAWGDKRDADRVMRNYCPVDNARRQFRVNRYTPDKAWHGST